MYNLDNNLLTNCPSEPVGQFVFVDKHMDRLEQFNLHI